MINLEKNDNGDKKKGFSSLFRREKKPKVSKQAIDLLPFVCFKDDYILLKDGTYMEIMQIETTDLYSKKMKKNC